MPKKKKGKKGKKVKPPSAHELKVKELTEAGDAAERIYRDTRDLNERLSKENEERRLLLIEQQADADERAELFEWSERQDARARAQGASKWAHDVSILEARVAQLRLRRERRTELFLENEALESDLETARVQAVQEQEAADAEAVDDDRRLNEVERDAEDQFRAQLSERVDVHFKTAYNNLNAVAKAKYRRTEVLREELAMQREGIQEIDRRIAEDTRAKASVRSEVRALARADHDKAVALVLEKRKRDQAVADARRLETRAVELRAEADRFAREARDTLSVAPRPPPPPGHASDGGGLAHLEGVLRSRGANLAAMEARAEAWARRGAAARACAVDVRNGDRAAGPPPSYDDAARSLDDGDGAAAPLDAVLWRRCRARWTEADVDLVGAPAPDAASLAPSLPALSKSAADRSRKTTARRPRAHAKRVQPAPISRRAPASLGAAQIKAFRSIARFERVRAATDLKPG